MKASLNTTMNSDFPKKNYTKYRSQSKTNPLFNKLNQDIGYPQQILHHSDQDNKNIKNYLQQNKKNLKNFFADRLPQKQIDIWRQNYTIDPATLFSLKKKQQEMRLVTRSSLNENLSENTPSLKKKSTKVSQNFKLNDKNKDFKQKFFNDNFKPSQPYESDNFLRGTKSYIQKYRQIVKKKAYNSVFGPETSARPRKMSESLIQQSIISRPHTFTTNRMNKNRLFVDSKSKQLERKKFSSLIEKIDKHRQNFDPQNKAGLKAYVQPPPIQNKQEQKSEMITWIRDVTAAYKFQSIDSESFRIKDIQDIQKIDNEFYRKLQIHKNKRLSSRQGQVTKTISARSNNSTISQGAHFAKNKINSKHNGLQLSKIHSNSSISVKQQQQQNSSISSSDESIHEDRPQGVLSLGYYIKKLGRQLVNALYYSHIAGITNTSNIYKAFWMNPEPYEKSGSYAFFKAIKKGDLQGIKKFLNLDPDYIYQRDHKGRSPLIYAVANNQTVVAQFILTKEVNVNQKCFNRRSSLYYALKNKNLILVKKLLQSGAIPWSSKNCNLNQLLRLLNNEKFSNLFKNARKIAIALKLKHSMIQRIAMWKQMKQKISQFDIFTFD